VGIGEAALLILGLATPATSHAGVAFAPFLATPRASHVGVALGVIFTFALTLTLALVDA